jgi:Low molecular weight phosphotyrosine protein phosphatase
VWCMVGPCRVNPAAVAAMAERGIDISKEFPKPWTDETVRAVDVVITMGCGDACPIFPGKRYEEWVLDDPRARTSRPSAPSATRSNAAPPPPRRALGSGGLVGEGRRSRGALTPALANAIANETVRNHVDTSPRLRQETRGEPVSCTNGTASS